MKYDESSITGLSQREHVRLRPNVYIGAVDEVTEVTLPIESDGVINFKQSNINFGYFTAVREIIDNAIDIILMTKVGNTVEINCQVVDNGGVLFSVKDNSVGVPIGKNENGVSTPELVFGQLMTGKNFTNDNNTGIGVNGMGSAIVNFLSTHFTANIHRDGKNAIYQWEDGILKKSSITKSAVKGNGTEVSFILDNKFFNGYILQFDDLAAYLSMVATAYKNITFKLNNIIVEPYKCNVIDTGDFIIYIKEGNGNTVSMVNSILTYRHGNHVIKVADSLYEAVKVKIGSKMASEIKSSDLKSISDMIIIYKSKEVKFDTQNKARLTSQSQKIDHKEFYGFLNNSSFIEYIKEKIEILHLKEAAKEVKKDLKRQVYKNVFAAKQGKCNKTQLYITEGLSAISSFLTCRKAGQAGLSLRGKILNVLEERISSIAKNEEIKSLTDVVGINLLDMNKNKYCFDEIIICTDIDPDGYHIASLLVNFFFKFSPSLIKEGRLKHLKSPLYSVVYGGKHCVFYDRAGLDDFIRLNKGNIKIRYNKGLGGLCPKTEWPVMVDHEKQVLETIEWDDMISNTLKVAFGDNNDTRRDWLSCK